MLLNILLHLLTIVDAGDSPTRPAWLNSSFRAKKLAAAIEVIERGGTRGWQAFFNSRAFAIENSKRRSLRVIGPGDEFEVVLAGSARAIAEMERCQAAQ